jgi:AraC-like DNA-binding protein
MSTIGSVYVFSLVGFLSVLFGLNYLIRKGQLVVAKILSIQFLFLGYLVAVYYLQPENMLATPYFFLSFSPLFYALPPLNFLFLWYLLHPRAKFKPVHYLLFIPFLLQLIENIPFYLSSKATKIELMNGLSQGDYFVFIEHFMWFDPAYHFYGKFAMFLIFYAAMVNYYLGYRRKAGNQILFQDVMVHYWIIGILVFRFITLFYLCYSFIFLEKGRISFSTTDYFLIAESCFHLLFLAANLKFLDVLLLAENLRGPNPEKEEVLVSVKEKNQLSELAGKIEDYFKTSEVFLNSQLTAELLGSLTGHPHRLIGQAIRHTHGISFRDYLNNYRIAYLEEKLTDPEFLAKSTVEKIAESAGFGTRQSFYTSFKKAKGCTPKEYFKSRIG